MRFTRVLSLAVCVLFVGASSQAQTIAAGNAHTAVVTPDGIVWTWGSNASGQLGDGTTTARAVPGAVANLTGITAVAAGLNHTLALKSDGSVWAWGANASGQLGDGTTTARSEPVPVTGISNVVAIAAGDNHSVAMTSDGHVWTWGANNQGQLGDGTTTMSKQPLVVSTTMTVTAIASGGDHTLVVKNDGTVWAWGYNVNGQLGDNSTTRRTSPVQMSGVTGASKVAAGSRHSLILKTDGTVRAVGLNSNGQLGDNTLTQRTTSVAVSTLTEVTAIAAGGASSYARGASGTMSAWGLNADGQLGDGTTTVRKVPTALSTPSGVALIAAGQAHAIAVTSSGVVWTWGNNGSGRLGDGTTASRATPGAISDVNYAWKVGTPELSVAGGTYNDEKTVVVTCATAGADIHYTLNGDVPAETDPVIASGASLVIDQSRTVKLRAMKTGMPASDLASAVYTLAVALPQFTPPQATYNTPQVVAVSTVSPGATIRYTLDGSVPNETSALYTGPMNIGTTTTVKAVASRANWTSSSVVTAVFTMNFGTLAAPVFSSGTGTYADDVTLVMTAMPGATIRYTTTGSAPTSSSPIYTAPLVLTSTTTIIAKAFHPDYTTSPSTTGIFTFVVATPVVTPAGGTYPAGQLITATCATSRAVIRFTTNGSTPTTNSPVFPPSGLAAGNFTLKVAAWRSGATLSEVVTRTYRLTGALTSAVIAGGWSHSIAVRPDGVVFGWGFNNDGQVGDGTTIHRLLPVAVNGGVGIAFIAAGDTHSLARTSDGRAVAWGSNGSGQLGDGSITDRGVPTAISNLSGVIGLAAGTSHSLGLTGDGQVWAWGYNGVGQLGLGDTTRRLAPVAITGVPSTTAIAAGGSRSYAVTSTGAVWSWGANRTIPAAVTGFANVTALAAGSDHLLALLGDGTVLARGPNGSGQLGDGTWSDRWSPAPVPGLTQVIAIAAGGTHSLALRDDGTVWAWGSNGYGELGDGTTYKRNVPTLVAGLPAIAVIGSGMNHSMAIGVDGSVWTWGNNDYYGQLGDGTTTRRSSPVQIAGPGMAWKIAAPALSLASGLYATEQNVTVTCADPDAVIHYTVDGSEPGDDAAVIASGGTLPITVSTILKVRASKPGAVWSELTIGSYELKVATPIVVPPSGAYAVPQAVTATTSTSGATFTFTTDTTEPEPSSTPYTGAIAVAGTRTIKVRGYRPGWTPSDSAAASYWIVSGTASTPVLAPGGGSFSGLVLVSITAGADETIRYTTDGSDPGVASPLYAHPFVLRTSTVVKARAFRGNYAPGAVASATYAFSAEAASPRPSIVPGGGRFATAQTVHVTAPANATIRYTTNGLDPADTDPEVPASGDVIVARSVILKVRAWSSGGIPSTVSRADFIITGAVASGYQHHLALTAAGEVWAWGNPWQHAVGDGSGPLGGPDVPPVVVLSNAVGVSACYSSSLAVKADGTVWNWGTTFSGQIGRLPVQVPGLADVVAVATGRYHALALERDGTVWAWGSNTSGELGDGSTTSRGTPAPVPGLSGVTSIAVGDHFSLAVQGDGAAGGAVWAWGANDTGQLGDGSVVRRLVPVRVIGLETATAVAAGASFALARLSDGTVRAWGADDHLQLGDSVAATTTVPVAIDGLAHVVAIAAGVNHALAVDDEGRVWGWGTTGAGQLGQTEYSSTTGVGAPLRLPFLAGAAGLGAGTSDSLVLRFDGTFWHSVTGGAPALTLADNATLFEDADRDGLVGWQEHLAGTDALNADTNGNGLSDLVDVRRRSQAANPDSDADGVPDLVELASGTNPFAADTDGDGVNDLLDAFPLDPTRTQLPPPVPGDTTPPTITLTLPTNARPIGGGL